MSALTPKADIQVVAYDTADQNVRSNFGRLVVTIAVVLEATRAAMATDLRPETTVAVAENATGWLKPLIGVPARSSTAKPMSIACLNRRQSSMD